MADESSDRLGFYPDNAPAIISEPLVDPAPQRPSQHDAVRAVETLIRWIGDDPEREGVRGTPMRFLRAWLQDWGKGYHAAPPHLTMFNNGGSYNEMVIVRNIEFHSHCEHHLAPFFGTVDIGYIPTTHIVGLSKLARVVEHYARRLQVQERLTVEIADYIETNMVNAREPQVPLIKGLGVIVRAQHMCMCSRGVHKPEAQTVTSALRGCIFDVPATRAEFLRLAGI